MNYLSFAENVPSLGSGGKTISAILLKQAGALSDGDVIIDIGCYLGSTTAFMAAGLLASGIKAEIHCFDQWVVDEELSHKMRFYNGIYIDAGESIEPLFDTYLSPFDGVKIIKHKQSIMDARWRGPKIRLLVDDICSGKQKTDHMMKTFSPSFLPGETIIVMMDYYFYETKKPDVFFYQKRFMERNANVFKFIERGPKESRAAVFQFMGGDIDYDVA